MADQKIQKMVVVGRLWDKENNSKAGYLEFGVFGRLQIVMLPNDSRGEGTSNFNILMKVEDTPYGSLRKVAKHIDEALFEDE